MTCKNLCNRKSSAQIEYLEGAKYCTICKKYIRTDDTYCFCCKYRLDSRLKEGQVRKVSHFEA
jgi:hypothetical protein